jgi:hypothetical protein
MNVHADIEKNAANSRHALQLALDARDTARAVHPSIASWAVSSSMSVSAIGRVAVSIGLI